MENPVDGLGDIFSKESFSPNQSNNHIQTCAYTFMNKTRALFDVDMYQGIALSITNIREEHLDFLPVFFLVNDGLADMVATFNRCWQGRKIPASRDGVKGLLYQLNISLEELAEKAMGLSLSDQYWIRPVDWIKWEDVNFFTNRFSSDIGELLVQGHWNGGEMSSPDNTSDGVIKKRWVIMDDIRYLLKGSTGIPWQAQPRREVLASRLAEVLLEPFSAPHLATPYHLYQKDGEEYALCANFVDVDTEYVQFNQLVSEALRKDPVAFFAFCRRLYGDKAYVLDVMLILDYVMLNEDRHTGNFGIIRSAETGKILGPAPIFDTGSSLFHTSLSILPATVKAKPFYQDHDQQIGLVNLSLYTQSLELVRERLPALFDNAFKGSGEGEQRLAMMLEVMIQRTEVLIKKGCLTNNA